MELTVTEASERLGVAPSTLRYWEKENLLEPARRRGQRRYQQQDLRRAALLSLARDLGLPLATAVSILDGSSEQRLQLIEGEVQRLEDLIGRAQGAQELLANTRKCVHERPATNCPMMQEALDRILLGQDPRP